MSNKVRLPKTCALLAAAFVSASFSGCASAAERAPQKQKPGPLTHGEQISLLIHEATKVANSTNKDGHQSHKAAHVTISFIVEPISDSQHSAANGNDGFETLDAVVCRLTLVTVVTDAKVMTYQPVASSQPGDAFKILHCVNPNP